MIIIIIPEIAKRRRKHKPKFFKPIMVVVFLEGEGLFLGYYLVELQKEKSSIYIYTYSDQ